MKDELVRLIPEFNKIEDVELREKVFSVWFEALEIGGWDLEGLARMPYTLLVDRCGYIFSRTCQCRLQIMHRYGRCSALLLWRPLFD